MKQEISLPHHHCFPGEGGQLPEYKNLSPVQFTVEFLGCLQDEPSITIKNNMIEYGRHSKIPSKNIWTTAHHTNLSLLEEIEGGKCSWQNPGLVEKIQIQNNARIITPMQNRHPTANPLNPMPKKRSVRSPIATIVNKIQITYRTGSYISTVTHNFIKRQADLMHTSCRTFKGLVHQIMRRKKRQTKLKLLKEKTYKYQQTFPVQQGQILQFSQLSYVEHA